MSRPEVGRRCRGRPRPLGFLHKHRPAGQAGRSPRSSSSSPTPPRSDAAAGQLVALGEPAVPFLREAANNLDDPDFAGPSRPVHPEHRRSPRAALVDGRRPRRRRPQAGRRRRRPAPVSALRRGRQGRAGNRNRPGRRRPQRRQTGVGRGPRLTDATPVRRAAAAVALFASAAKTRRQPSASSSKTPRRPSVSAPPWPSPTPTPTDAVPVLIDLLADLPDGTAQTGRGISHHPGRRMGRGRPDRKRRHLAASCAAKPGTPGGAASTTRCCSMNSSRAP